MTDFVQATSSVRKGDVYVASIDPDWFIWGPFGGYLAALALRAMAAHSSHRRPATPRRAPAAQRNDAMCQKETLLDSNGSRHLVTVGLI